MKLFIKSPCTKTKLIYEINMTQFASDYCDQLNVFIKSNNISAKGYMNTEYKKQVSRGCKREAHGPHLSPEQN